MSESGKPYTLSGDEKATKVMVYTADRLAWGDIVTKEMVRVNTFLRVIKPDYVSLYDVRVLPLKESGPERAHHFREIHMSTNQVLAFHLMPPASEPRDYDPSEENRKMEPVTVVVGPYRFDGHMRISVMTDLAKAVEIARETYISLYEAEVSLPGMSSLRGIRTDMVVVQRDQALFAGRL